MVAVTSSYRKIVPIGIVDVSGPGPGEKGPVHMIIPEKAVDAGIALEEPAIPDPVVQRIITLYSDTRYAAAREAASPDGDFRIIPPCSVAPCSSAEDPIGESAGEDAIGYFDAHGCIALCLPVIPPVLPVDTDAFHAFAMSRVEGETGNLVISRAVGPQ
jgi:hypothetical protein